MKYNYLLTLKVLLGALKNFILMKLQGRPNKPIFANCFPKAGTHMFKNVLLAMDSGLRLSEWNEIKAFHYDGSKAKPAVLAREFKNGNTSVCRNNRYTGSRRQTSLEWWAIFKSSDDRRLILGLLAESKVVAKVMESMDFPSIFLLRDPRDIVVSRIHSALGPGKSYIQLYLKSLPDFDTCVRRVILGDREFPEGHILHYNIDEVFRKYKSLMSGANVLHVKYEDLISPEQERRVRCLKGLIDHCGFDYTEERIANMLKAFKLRPHTFRKGSAGSWKKDMSEDNKALFKEVAGQLLIDLGYERGLNW